MIRGEVQFVEIGWDQIGWDLDCTWFWKAPTCSLRAVFLYERPSREVQERSPAASMLVQALWICGQGFLFRCDEL